MEKITERNKLIDMIFASLITLVLYFLISIFELQHYLMFILPVPFAIYILKNNVKSALLPMVFTIFAGSLVDFRNLVNIANGSPFDLMYFWRGIIFLSLSFLISIVHGYLPKTGISPLKELGLVLATDFLNGLILTVVFLNLKDSIVHSTHHYGELLMHLFNVSSSSNFFVNFVGVANNIEIGYIFFIANLEAVLTHICIHLFITYFLKIEKNHTFSGLIINIRERYTVIFLIIFAAAMSFFFVANNQLHSSLIILYGIGFNIVIAFSVYYIFQGISLLFHIFAALSYRRTSLLAFILGLIFFPLTFVIGIIDSLCNFSPKLVPHIKSELTTVIVTAHAQNR